MQLRKKWEQAYGMHLGAMDSDSDDNNPNEVGFHRFVTEEVVSYTGRLLQLKLSAKYYHDRYLKQNAAYLKELRDERNAEFTRQSLGKKTFQTIKGAIGSGLQALKRKVRGPKGQVAGTYTTNAFEIDQMLNDAWSAVYEGNVTSHKKLVDDFKAKYGKYIYTRNGGAFKLNP